jgi:hypothetical protein
MRSPFVVTVSVSVFAACGGSQKNTPPTTEKQPTTVVVPEPTQEIAEGEADAAAPPEPDRPNRTAKAEWTISRVGDRCQSSPKDSCPPTAKCNPPEPVAYECPAGQERFPATVTRAEGETECKMLTYHYYNVHCSPGRTCNPPPPRKELVTVPCPE